MTGNILDHFRTTDSHFGWPIHRRQHEFETCLAAKPTATDRVNFKGQTEDMPIIRVPIGLPKYRLNNVRTISLQEEHLAGQPATRSDLFSEDPEMLDAQHAQHELLLPLAHQQKLYGEFKNPSKKQHHPLLLSEYGFVVNGNRRLAAWRDLYHSDPETYGHLSHIDVVVLPHCEEHEIERIESALQIQEDFKADYAWHAIANAMHRKQHLEGSTEKQLGDLYGKRETKIREYLEMRDYAEEFLRSRNREHRWSDVTKSEEAFRKIVTTRSKISSLGEKELFKQAAFIVIEGSDEVGERLYGLIPEIREFMPEIKESLQVKFVVTAEPGQGGLEDLFGGSESSELSDIPLAKTIERQENISDARAIILDVIESQRQLLREAGEATFLTTQLAKANAVVKAALQQGLKAETDTKGVSAQIAQIRNYLDEIEAWLGQRA